ncbi:uncharacterized protein B0I36DRAFT_344806 [Microdochium trichocladiopsis]|uniref:Uncharacterized protein n=1 Tax=Microdochium trichocladiopsis TaxID=1682393 RepID=A0A9P8YIL7_9PEZI|nr:uncharacterized protein B0I36DRAFT_344806 [Microdochium trichocladiopsis]KAH7041181.1 hypothetical protein B0I36DRAFT_344806 [Microdochium trichocladiopsis]
MAFDTKYILIPVFIACSLFGFRASIGTILGTGFGKVVKDLAAGNIAFLPGAPQPFLREYAGIGPLDRKLVGLVAFFSTLIDGDVDQSTVAFSIWGLAQFGSAWTLLVLEARRNGNRYGLLGWVGPAGLAMQLLTYTFIAPIWLSLHLLISPVAKLRNGDGEAARKSLFVLLWDMALLPAAITITYLVPSTVMNMPSLASMSASAHYKWIAAWQLFPLWTVLVLYALHAVLYTAIGSLLPRDEEDKPTTLGKGYTVAVSGVYEFVTTVTTMTHLPVVILSVLPDSARSLIAGYIPRYAAFINSATFSKVFVPYWITNIPKINPTGYVSGDLAVPAKNFLQWDVYVGSIPFVLWALYLHQRTVKNPSLPGALALTAKWFVLGGPLCAVAALLKERDNVVLEGDNKSYEAKTK